MHHGFISVAAGTPAIRVGDCAFNEKSIIALITRARERGVIVLTLPELCITGYSCADLFLQSHLLDAAQASLISIINNSSRMLISVGVPLRHNGMLYNCAAVICDGVLLGVVAKSVLSNYGELHELRHFAPAPVGRQAIRIGGREVPFGTGLLFKMDDMDEFVFGVEIGSESRAIIPPSSRMAQMGAALILNPSANPEIVGEKDRSRLFVKSQSSRLACAYVCANAGFGESTASVVFSGHNIVAENGEILAESKPFENSSPLIITEIDLQRLSYERRRNNTFSMEQGEVIPFKLRKRETVLTRSVPQLPFVPAGDSSVLKDALLIQAQGLVKRIIHTGAKPVIGVSGGLDSTLALLVVVRALEILGKDYRLVHAVTMPCFGTTPRTAGNAEKLCAAHSIPLRHIDISDSVRRHFDDIGHSMDNYDAAYENAQARERTQVLMDIANQIDGIVIGTGDLSELALGFCTFNGDHMSMYSVNASIPKTLVRELVKYCADSAYSEELCEVLYSILETPVSPELLPSKQGESGQETESIIGPYELHDFFLYHFLRYGASPDKIQRLAEYSFADTYDAKTISSWLGVFFKRFFSQQFKRSCMPDGPKTSEVSLSAAGGFIMPSDTADGVWKE